MPRTSPPCLLLRLWPLWLPAAVPAAEAALVINEILPDPPGSDAGHEFVEFLNTGQEAFDLEGVEFQFANGAEGPVWRSRWRGPAGLVLEPGRRFLLVDRTWADQPPADDEATLALQNGPDAVRLVRDGVVLDLLGYGALTDPELTEGEPAGLAPGQALARRPDGRDTGDNAADFVAAVPTPGAVNFRRWSAASSTPELEPPSLLRPGEAVTVRATLHNDGLEPWPGADVLLDAGAVRARAHLDGLDAGGSRTVAWLLRPASPGSLPLTVSLRPGAAPESLRVDLGRIQVGTAPVVINEVLAAPGAGQGEWFELLVPGPDAVDLGGWAVRDEDGAWIDLPARRVPAGGTCVCAQDSAALAAWLEAVASRGGAPDCTPASVLAQVVELPGWAGLNNTAPADRSFADRLRLRDVRGTTVDHVVIGAVGGPDAAGRSLERTSVAPVHPAGTPWAACTAGPGSTPGCANSVALWSGGPGPAELSLAPAILDPARGAASLHALFAVAHGATGWRLRLYDLWGALVRDFGGDSLGPGPRDLLWDGRDDAGTAVPPGGYVFLLETWADEGAPARTLRLCAVR